MMMWPVVRKFALTAHNRFGRLARGRRKLPHPRARGAAGSDPKILRGLDFAMWLTGWYIAVPFCFASLLTGLVMSVGSRWDLFGHYLVTVNFLLTVITQAGVDVSTGGP